MTKVLNSSRCGELPLSLCDEGDGLSLMLLSEYRDGSGSCSCGYTQDEETCGNGFGYSDSDGDGAFIGRFGSGYGVTTAAALRQSGTGDGYTYDRLDAVCDTLEQCVLADVRIVLKNCMSEDISNLFALLDVGTTEEYNIQMGLYDLAKD